MKTENLQHIQDIVSAVDIDGNKQVLLAGKPYRPDFTDPYLEKPGNKMIFELIHRLIYEFFYTKTEKQVSRNSLPGDTVLQSIKQLSEANMSVERFDVGWYIQNIDVKGNIIAQKGNMKRFVYPGGFLTDAGSHQQVEKNTPIRLFMPKELKDSQSVFYFVYGETGGEENSSELARVYFNTSFEGNCLLVNSLTLSLNNYFIPFIFKCLSHPSFYNRIDTSVLYFDKKYAHIVFDIFSTFSSSIKGHLRDGTPLFTKPLGKGISFAETPPVTGESFGTHWSKIIAAGIMHAYEGGIPKDNWVNEIVKHICDNHQYTDLGKLYLNPGSVYPYQFPVYA